MAYRAIHWKSTICTEIRFKKEPVANPRALFILPEPVAVVQAWMTERRAEAARQRLAGGSGLHAGGMHASGGATETNANLAAMQARRRHKKNQPRHVTGGAGHCRGRLTMRGFPHSARSGSGSTLPFALPPRLRRQTFRQPHRCPIRRASSRRVW